MPARKSKKSSKKAGQNAAPQNRKGAGGGNRGPDGRFKKGNRANPGGRPKADKTVIDLARKHTREAIAGLLAIAREGESEASRVAAWREILDRAWGKPRQAVEHSGPEGEQLPSAIPVYLVKPEGDE